MSKFDRQNFQSNKRAAEKLKTRSREFGVKTNDFQSILTAGWQKIQLEMYKLEAILGPKDVQLAYASVAAGDGAKRSFDQTTSSFTPERKKLISALIMFIIIMSLLAGCASPATGTPLPPSEEAPLTVAAPSIETAPPPTTEIVVGATPTEIAMQATSLDAVALYRDPIYQVGSFTIWKVRDGVDSPYSADMVFMESPFVGKEEEILFIDLSNFAEEVPGVTHVGIGTKNGETVVTGLNSSNQIIGYVGYDTATGTANYTRATAEDNIQANVEKGYFDMTPAEQLLQSEGNVKEVTNYNGDVSFIPVLDGEKHPEYLSYWSPTAPTEYGLNGNGSWVSSHNTPKEELDTKGDSFPPIAIKGRENPDGSLVMIDPDTGAEVTFGKIFVPGFGEITMKELYAMHNQNEFGTQLGDALLENSNMSDNPDHLWSKMIKSAPLGGVFVPGFKYGEQNNFYSTLSGAGTKGVNELPEENKIYYEAPTNSFMMPIFSPETGAFMFWLNIQQGNMVSTLTIQYSENGSSYFDTVPNRVPTSFGWDGQQDEFGVLIVSRDAEKSHMFGGAKPILQGGEGIGDINDIEAILNATTEQEIMNIMNQVRIFVSNPVAIAFPER